VLHRILREEAARQGIQVEYHKRLKDLATVDGEEILASFQDGTTAQGDFLVGADGVHSRAREVIFPGALGPSYLGVLGVGGFVAPSVLRSWPRGDPGVAYSIADHNPRIAEPSKYRLTICPTSLNASRSFDCAKG